MMPQSGNFDGQGNPNTGSSLMGFFKSPGQLLQGYNQVPDQSGGGGGGTMPMSDGLSSSATRLFGREHLRGMSEVVGTGEDNAFGCVLSPPTLLERLRYNFTYFYLNYMVLTAVLFALNIVFRPSAWIGIGFLAVAWIGMTNSIQDERMLKAASVGMAITSSLVLYWLLKGAFWTTIYISMTAIVFHAMLRDTATLVMMSNDGAMMAESSGFYQQPQLVGV